MGTLYYGDNLDILCRYHSDKMVFSTATQLRPELNPFLQEKDGTAAASDREFASSPE
jgi:hypothetical protein